MTSNTGPKKHKRKFQYLNKTGARGQRQEFMETHYVKGIVNMSGEQVIRPLNAEEVTFLNKFYKEGVHGTFVTDVESKALFKEASRLTKLKSNVEFFESNGCFPLDVEEAIIKFEDKSKSLGNMIYKFWDQKDVNSDDYKRRHDIQNKAGREFQLVSFEDLQYIGEVEDKDETFLEDLITESED
jgi:hypothetical protein